MKFGMGERTTMRPYTEYWAAMMVRGFVAILFSTAVLFISGLAATILLLPLAIVISMLCLAAYGVLDSVIVIASSFMVPADRPGRLMLLLLGVVGVAIGILMFSIIYDRVTLHWFLYLAAAQAFAVAVAELIAARRTSAHHGSKWCYTSAAIAAVSAAVLLSLRNLEHWTTAWVIYGYLGLFGLNLVALSANMLFARAHSSSTIEPITRDNVHGI
ncbi:MAG: hypothetical protein WDN23_01215 [Edaphobacter sp.]